MLCDIKLPINCKTTAKNNSKRDLPSQVNDHEVTVLLFDPFSVKTHFFKLELFLVYLTYLTDYNLVLLFYTP